MARNQEKNEFSYKSLLSAVSGEPYLCQRIILIWEYE